jgi:RecA-family ATPase
VDISLQQIAAALGGEIRNGAVLAPGPGHSPQDRSLSVRVDPNAPDGFLVHSFANDDGLACKQYVRERCGLLAFKPARRPPEDITALVQQAVASQHQAPKSKPVAVYPYTDGEGSVLYEVLRYVPKTFRQRRPNGNGGWIWKLGERRVLYRLPELLKYPDATLFVCEGEKDADRVASLGHCATTVASGKWTDECVTALAGRNVVILQDNDAPGAAKAQATAELLRPVASSVRVVLLPGLPDGGDVSDWLDAGHTADQLVEACFGGPEKPKATLPFADIAAWSERDLPLRDWAVQDRFPLRNVSMLSGEGAIGKSVLTCQLGAAHVLGRDWLGTLPELGPAIIVNAEDEEDELHRRFADIARHYGVGLGELKRDLHVLSLAGQDAVLGHAERNGLVKPTPLFHRLSEAAKDIRPRLIVLDTAADSFGGNENDRAQVRQFIGLLRGMAIAANAAVLVCAHPSLTGMNSGSGLSGSTGWHNSVRARAYLHALPDTDPALRRLDFMKSNYSAVAESITIRWANGVFKPEARLGSLEKVAADAAADHVFLQLLERFNRQGRAAGDRKGPSYAPALFADEPEAKVAGLNSKTLADAMRRLFTANKIHTESYGPPSRRHYRLVMGAAQEDPK